MLDLIKANEVIDEIKQHEDFTMTYRVLDLTSCGLIGVSDASLGCVDRCGCPTDQDKTQDGIGIFIGEKSLVSLGATGKFNVLKCDFSQTQECVARWYGFASGLNAALWRSAERDPWRSSKKLHTKQNATEWSKTIVTDAQTSMTKSLPKREDSHNRKL